MLDKFRTTISSQVSAQTRNTNKKTNKQTKEYTVNKDKALANVSLEKGLVTAVLPTDQ